MLDGYHQKASCLECHRERLQRNHSSLAPGETEERTEEPDRGIGLCNCCFVFMYFLLSVVFCYVFVFPYFFCLEKQSALVYFIKIVDCVKIFTTYLFGSGNGRSNDFMILRSLFIHGHVLLFKKI